MKNKRQFPLFVFVGLVCAIFLVTSGVRAAERPNSFADLAARLAPSVVNVYTTQKVKVSSSPFPFMFPDNENIPEEFRRFFGMPDGHENGHQREMKRQSLGSGVIVSADGHILTNNHVVKDADEISIKLSDFEEFPAKVIGRDEKSDIALLKIDAKKQLQPVVFGDSDALRVGDWVLAIGNPFGLEQTVTAGIVSAKGRAINSENYGNFIQTDASINPGNSGGPLLNLAGELVGINTAIFSRSGGNMGIGFAIPANMAKNIMDQLQKNGKVIRGWLGVVIQHVDQELARKFNLDRPIGALVGEVVPGSPAAKAGIKPGDVIVKFKEKEIVRMSMLPGFVGQTPVGEKAAVEIVRNGKPMTLTVTIGKMDEEMVEAQATSGGAGKTTGSKSLGITVQEVTKELADSLSLKKGEGLLITEVKPNSPASFVRLKKGDLVLELNRKPVNTIDQFRKELKRSKADKSLLLLIKRDSRTRFIVLKMK